jgi:alanyl-tRNA synthetase
MGARLASRSRSFYKARAVLARTMGDVFPELRAQQKHVEEVLRREEESFNRTLDKGIEQFGVFSATGVAECLVFPGVDSETAATRRFSVGRNSAGQSPEDILESAAALYPDCQIGPVVPITGFAALLFPTPTASHFDLTELMARERGLTVDVGRV